MVRRQADCESAALPLAALYGDCATMHADDISNHRQTDARAADRTYITGTMEALEDSPQISRRYSDPMISHRQDRPFTSLIDLAHANNGDHSTARTVLDRIAYEVVEHTLNTSKVPFAHQHCFTRHLDAMARRSHLML